MFTGIITAIGIIKKIDKNNNFILTIQVPAGFIKKVKLGDSIAVDGVCLTVAKILKQVLVFELMPETVELSIAKNYLTSQRVNMEKSMRVGEEVGGHFVSGHVDGVGKVVKIKKIKESVILSIKPPARLLKYLAHKGSVTLNGVSLTIIKTKPESELLEVSLVSYTLKHTNLSQLLVGDLVNIEIDLLAKYLENLLNIRQKNKNKR